MSGIDATGESATAGAEPPQALIGYRTNEEWQALVDEVGALIASLDEIGDAEQSQKVFAALEGIVATRTMVAFKAYSAKDLDALWNLG